MEIEHVYIPVCPWQVHYARCCVASIRHWHPDIPITLLKDESVGSFSTREIERYWAVELLDGGRQLLGGGWAKIEPLCHPQRQRCLVVDCDTVFLGPLLDRLAEHEADFVVEAVGGGSLDGPLDWMHDHYFDLDALRAVDPDYRFPGFTFNTGALVATTGILARADFDPLISWKRRPEPARPGLLAGHDQGPLNYVLTRKAQRGELSLERVPFMSWALVPLPHVRYRVGARPVAAPRTAVPTLAHWAGKKHPIFLPTPNARLLRRYEALYYRRLPGGRVRRRGRAAQAAGDFIRHTFRSRLPARALNPLRVRAAARGRPS